MADNVDLDVNVTKRNSDRSGDLKGGDVADSWEDLEDDENFERDIEKRQAQYKASTAEKVEQEKKRLANMKVCENSIEGQYRPQLKILKREANDNDQQTCKQTEVKSLEERQMEYMRARERILGSARPEEYEYSDGEGELNSTPKQPVKIQKR